MKTLIVEYTIDGKPFTAKATDRSVIHLSDNAIPVQIDKAIYGVPGDPQRTRDVRDKLQRLVDAGERSFVVARMAEGDDPAYLVVKTLDVEFTIERRAWTRHGYRSRNDRSRARCRAAAAGGRSAHR